MAHVVLPFLMSMLLGRSIDLTSYAIGNNVYDDAQYDETSVKNLNATYHVLQEDIFPYSFFGLPADIVLRIKSNYLSSTSGAMGLDGFLRDTSWKYNSAIVSIVAIYRTVDRSLKKDASPLPDWKDLVPASQTHYASSLYYGGWFSVLFRFQCDIPGDVQIVRKTLTETLGKSGNLDNDTISLWNKTLKAIQENENIRGLVQMSTHVYTNVPLTVEINSQQSLMEAVNSLPEVVGETGLPLYAVLKPLHDLDEKYPVAEQKLDMVKDLEKLDEMFDDVKITKVSLMRWVTETLSVFSDDDELRISNLLDKINDCIRAFNKVANEASLFKSMDQNVLDSAFKAYLTGLERGQGTYNLAYRRLKEEIDAQCGNSFLHKIKGLLKVYEHEAIEKGKVEDGIEECRKLCLDESRCRAIGFAEHISQLDLNTGLYFKKLNQCWIYFRSTSTAIVTTPSGMYGDMGIYDRNCY